MDISHLIHSLVDGLLDGFHILAIIDNAAVKLCVQLFEHSCYICFHFSQVKWNFQAIW